MDFDNNQQQKFLRAQHQLRYFRKGEPDDNPYLKNRSTLLTLIQDHPFYKKKVQELRQSFKIKPEEVQSTEALHRWETNNQSVCDQLRSEIKVFLYEFNFNQVYRYDIEDFTFALVVSDARGFNFMNTNVPSCALFEATDDEEVNAKLVTPNATYIQIFDWTTIEDLKKNWASIKDHSGDELKKITINELSREAWTLSQQGLSLSDIARRIRDSKPDLLDGFKEDPWESDIGVYVKRYRDQLNKLKPLQT